MDLEKIIIDEMRNQYKRKCELPEGKELLLYLHSMMLITGRSDIMYCNCFLAEATQLLINSIFLYEEGYFDCAFYSVRQASEVFNAMLYLSEDKDELKKWTTKERFPMDSKIRKKLEDMVWGYQEIKTILCDYFKHHRELINRCHKIIHKQGFDTFYATRRQGESSIEEDKKLFVETLKYTIGIGIILFVIVEPLSLALADDEVNGKLNFDFMTEPIDCDYFENFLGLKDVVEKLLRTKYYKGFAAQFRDKEQMNMATYTVIRDGAWNISCLEQIEKQIHLLNAYEQYMFKILKLGIKVTNFYYQNGWGWYITTNKSNYQNDYFDSSEFKVYINERMRFNQERKNVYISVVSMYSEKLCIEHNEKLTEEEINKLMVLEEQTDMEYRKLTEKLEKIQEMWNTQKDE